MGICEGWGLEVDERVADMATLYGVLLFRAARRWEIAVGGYSKCCIGVGRKPESSAVLGDSELSNRFLVIHYAGASSSQVIPSCTTCRLL